MLNQKFVYQLKTVGFLIILTIFMPSCSKSSTNSNGNTGKDGPAMSLQEAVLSGNLEVVKKHIEASTDINEKEPLGGSTPLITAATFNRIEIAKVLIDAGANLAIKNKEGSTALHAAAFFGRVEIVKLLINAKADKTIRNKQGATAREIVMVPFAEIKPIYQMVEKQLSPLGFKMDMEALERNRPIVANLLQ